jgi:inosine/xanthosine triphosphate pyrophosphatase family protein
MNKKFKLILFSIAMVGVVAFTGYNYVMYGGARNLSTENTAYTVSSKNIANEFETNIEMSNKKYLEKAIAIKGTITKITGTEVIIDDSIICNLKELDPSIMKNQVVTLKGRVVGYDDLMGELKLDQCFKAS